MFDQVSICMPFYNRQELLDLSLERIRDFYPGVEVVVADDGSSPPAVAEGCKVVRLPRKDHALNPCVPINAAVRASSGTTIVITNPENWHDVPVLDQMAEELGAAGPTGYVTASCVQDDGRLLAHSSLSHKGSALIAPRPEGSQFHFCAMLSRGLWDKAGGFDERYRDGQAFDDNDWLWRLEDVGAKFVHRDDLIVRHKHTGTKWPEGGWHRNAQLFCDLWSHKWGKAA